MTNPMPPPNVLFLLTDDQRFDMVGAIGNPAVWTPNLDRLAARGCACTRAHIPGGTSPAICMPSRAMIHTGRGLYEIAGAGESISEDHSLLGECFRQAGYTTFGTGKWHNGPEAYARSFSNGAEIFFGGMDDHWNVPACDFDPSGRYAGRLPTVRDPFGGKDQIERVGDHIRAGIHSTDLFTGATLDFLGSRDKTHPFFAYTAFMAPHDPRVMPQRFRDLYDAETLTLPANFQADHPFDTGDLDCRDEKLAAQPRDPKEIREQICDYYAMISHLDAAIGRLLDWLQSEGLLANTLIVLTGDNGLAVGQHGLMGKQNLYDHSVRVPLLLAGPGIAEGTRFDGLCTLSDLFPTLAELCGLPIPESVTSHSLAPALRREGDPPKRETLYLSYRNSLRGLTDGRYKLIEYAAGQTQLFDLAKDPAETANLAARADQAERLGELRRRLLEGRAQSYEDRHPLGGEFWKKRSDLG